MITQARLKELYQYSKSRGYFIRKDKRDKRKVGSINPDGYLRIRIDNKIYMAHRLAWLYVYGEYPSGEIDHINGVKNHNKFTNLRVVDRGKNNRNAKRRKDNKTGVTGVQLRDNGKYRAVVQYKKVKHYLGSFWELDDAKKAIDDFKKDKDFGESHGRGVSTFGY